MRGRNAAIVTAFPVEDSDHLMLITNQGKTIRLPVSGISVQRRAAQGVVLFRLEEGERVVSVERIADSSGEGEE
jgi:DNA gyrase subunit A